MIWLFFGIVVMIAIWGVAAMLSPGDRAPTRLNNQGLPRPTDRDDHRRNDEE